MECDDFMKAIHVELSDEGGHIGMFVIVGQEAAGKLGLVADTK